MQLDDLLAFGRHVHQHLRQRNADHSPLEQTYAEMIKINEEAGELCDAILARANNQRADKITASSDEHLAEEMADVVMTVFVLAANLELDLPQAIESKMKIVQERFENKR